MGCLLGEYTEHMNRFGANSFSIADSMTKQMRQSPGSGVGAEEAAALGTAYKDLP